MNAALTNRSDRATSHDSIRKRRPGGPAARSVLVVRVVTAGC
jgi:hypothetical protein